MRKLHLLILIAYVMAFTAPFLAAADETVYARVTLCSFANAPTATFGTDETEESGDSNQDKRDAEWKAYGKKKATFDSELSAKLGKVACGTANDYTKLLEKGDCTAEGQVITEITEVIAPNVELGDTDGAAGDDQADSKIMTVYAGTCCLAKETVYNTESDGSWNEYCEDAVTIYSDTYDGCLAAGAETCSRRQWVISDSGLGIVKIMVKQIYTWGAFTVGSMAVMTIILNGVRISMSGVSGDITEAKNKILQAVAGIVLLFLSGIILYTINPDFFS